jgi:hypothetical protein
MGKTMVEIDMFLYPGAGFEARESNGTYWLKILSGNHPIATVFFSDDDSNPASTGAVELIDRFIEGLQDLRRITLRALAETPEEIN